MNANTPLPSETAQKAVKQTQGSFWLMVRERMKEKAVQLYLEDHPETQEAPALKALRMQKLPQGDNTSSFVG